MTEMHRYDFGKTLPLVHAAKLTTAQLATLEASRQPKTISAIADDFGLSRPAMSQLVDKLVRAGLLLRNEGTQDRRERHVLLSNRGKRLLERVSAARAARFDAALARVPPALAAELSSVLSKVVEAFLAPVVSRQAL